MAKSRMQILAFLVVAAVLTVAGTAAHAQMVRGRAPLNSSEMREVAANTKAPHCSVATIVGKWVFITDLMHSQQGTLHGAAVGTLNVGTDGTLLGKYDFEGTSEFRPGVEYVGTVSVNANCSGVVSFHDVGSDQMVAQSIVIAHDGREIWGMFQDPAMDIGTYRAKRTGVPRCSVSTVVGKWVFTTDLLYLQDGTLDGYAIGTLINHKDGTQDQTFDFEATSGFYPGNHASGTLTVNPDCTGIGRFQAEGDNYWVVQSFVVADGGKETWGLFQDPTVDVGTFRSKRITEARD
ncbi:MAG TPA: hypothetical protein VMT53_08650 [Terriglobales bacterium]|nr:hypothetical protein [Terriglobales bacterium]